MKISDIVTDIMTKFDITDAFGIPGGIILELLYSFNNEGKIKCHLGYNEQGSVYSACGYAQVSNRPVIAYATHGPGILNMVTGAFDAYYDSLPVIFVTAHNIIQDENSNIRTYKDQEVNVVSFMKYCLKCAVHIEKIKDIKGKMLPCLSKSMTGRKGPVLLDFSSAFLSENIDDNDLSDFDIIPMADNKNRCDTNKLFIAAEKLKESKRPLMLLGDGINLSASQNCVLDFSIKHSIPMVSSRVSQDIANGNLLYYGYIGSHGIRYANFLLSKTDCLISIGNRLAFPKDSISYRHIAEKANIIRFEIDEHELERIFDNSTNICGEIKDLIAEFDKLLDGYKVSESWLKVGNLLKNRLKEEHITSTTERLIRFFEFIKHHYHSGCCFVSDVGNNEIFVSEAYQYTGMINRKIHSKSMKTSGSALPKAIGVYYALKKPVICFIGDQGLHFNLQELNTISKHNLPICIVVINNRASAMIRDSEIKGRYSELLHTTADSGYYACDLKKIACAYNIRFLNFKDNLNFVDDFDIFSPSIIEIIDDSPELQPVLPLSEPCQNLYPYISENLYLELNNL